VEKSASSVLHVFSKVGYKIIMKNITKAIGKRFKILFLIQIFTLNLQ